MKPYYVAIIVLNYNSADDVEVILPQLLAQQDVCHALIVVDNASKPEQVVKLMQVFADNCPAGIITTQQNMLQAGNDKSERNCFLVLNDENRGYSAGNNIGIRLAEALGTDAVLIVNPDVRIDNPLYVKSLATTLFGDENFCIAASRIIGLDGKDQNPLREPTFIEEFAWPFTELMRRFGFGGSYNLPVDGDSTISVPKVSGCCLMIRGDFLSKSCLLDENVFLYCEEPILSSKSRRAGKKIAFNPALLAVHAHQAGKKGNTSQHMLMFIKSRRYYILNYSGYGAIRKRLLLFSYCLLELIHKSRT